MAYIELKMAAHSVILQRGREEYTHKYLILFPERITLSPRAYEARMCSCDHREPQMQQTPTTTHALAASHSIQ